MKILHVVQGYTPSHGGSQWFAQQLAERQVRQYGNEVTVFTTVADDLEYFWRRELPALPAGTEIINGVTVKRFPVFNRLRWSRVLAAGVSYRLGLPYHDWLRTIQTGPIIWKLTAAVARCDADIVVASSFPLLHMHYALKGARRGRKPLVFIGALHPEDRWGYDRECIFRAIHQADAYVAQTPFERSYLVDRGIPDEKIRVIGPGVDLEPYERVDGRKWRATFGWGAEPIVCSVGKFVSRKRYDLLLAAMRLVWRKLPRVRLVVAGGFTEYVETLRKSIDDLPNDWDKNVTILTNISDEEKVGLLTASNLFVLPSLHESFGIAFLEAWAAGKPVIGVNSGAIASLVQDGETGLLFEPHSEVDLAKAITSLVTHSEQAKRLGSRGQKLVRQKFSWDNCVERFQSLYTELINSSC